MNSFGTVLNAVLPVFAIMGAGLLIRRLNWLTEEADQSLLRVVVNVLMPCLILDTALGNPAMHDWRNLALAPLIGVATVLLGVGLAWLAAPWCGLAPGPARRTFAVTTGLYNYGYIPLPLTVLLFDERTTSVLFLHNTGVEACVWTVLTLILTGGHGARDWRKLFNAPLLALGLALALNFTGTDAHLPAALRNVIHLLGVCAFPIALLLVGATIADQLGELRPNAAWGPVAPALVLRLGLLPVAFLALAKVLPLSVELKRVMVLEAAMPAAVLPIVLARHYGGDPALALRIVLGTSVVSLLTTPLWIGFGLRWVGLQ